MDNADRKHELTDWRREERHPIGVDGKYRRGAGVPTSVTLQDLSRSGCRFFDKFGNLKIGSEVTIRIGEFGPIIAEIRWRKDSYVGVSFEPPLHDAVLDYIRVKHPVK